MTTYASRITEITVFPEKEGIIGEGAVAIRVIDEGGGEFLELSQDGEHVRLDFEELPLLVAAVEQLRKGRPVEGDSD